MAISKVRVKVNGTWTVLTLNSSTGKYEGTITAPSTTSYNLDGGYYPLEVEATNDAGTVVTVTDSDATVGQNLRLVVKETIKPVITLNSPTDGAYLQSNQPAITFTITDEAGGSGVKESSVSLKVDNTSYGVSAFTKTAVTNGFKYTFTPTSALSDGNHTITINAKDNDGNSATAVSAGFVIDTVPPTLNVTSPTTEITNNPSCVVEGTTNDATSSPVTVTVKLNSGTEQSVTVSSDGSFSKSITLAEGTNTVTVKAKDAAGRTTTVTKTVKLDTTVPKIASVVLHPNPANASASVTISVEVE